MKSEMRYVPYQHDGQYHHNHERIFKSPKVDDLRGRRIMELDIAAVQITDKRQIDELIKLLQVAYYCFSENHQTALESHFDDYEEESTKELGARILRLKE